MKINDFVDIPQWKGTPDESARVVKVCLDGVVVTNMNMPFQGTLNNYFLTFKEIKERVQVPTT